MSITHQIVNTLAVFNNNLYHMIEIRIVLSGNRLEHKAAPFEVTVTDGTTTVVKLEGKILK